MTIEKEKSEKSPWIAKGMNEKSVFPVLRMEIRSPYHNVDLIFKSVCFIAITEPSADADIFEELHFEFQSVEYH